MRFSDRGLVLGAGTVLALTGRGAPAAETDEDDAKLAVLLAAAYGRSVPYTSLNHVRKAAEHWCGGEEGLASVHLALSRLGELEAPRQDAQRLFLADGLLQAGFAPETILEALDCGLAAGNRVSKYNPDQPRMPAGSGRPSGQWTDGAGGGTPGASSQTSPEPDDRRADPASSPAAVIRPMAAHDAFVSRLLQRLQGITPAEAETRGSRLPEVTPTTVTPASDGNLTQGIIEETARATITKALNDRKTSATAKAVLKSFLTGEGPRTFMFTAGSAGLAELFAYDPTHYTYKEIRGVIAYMMGKYHTPYLEDGYRVTAYTKAAFSPYDGLIGLEDGIQIGDVVGTMSKGWNLSIEKGFMHFRAMNSTTLTSYAGGNLLNHAGLHSVVADPKAGPFSPVRQEFDFSLPIPKYLRRPRR